MQSNAKYVKVFNTFLMKFGRKGTKKMVCLSENIGLLRMLMDQLKKEIKEVIISSLQLEDLKPENIEDSAALFGDGLGLDSIDALELGVALKKKFGVKFSAESGENKKHFASVNALAEYIQSQRA